VKNATDEVSASERAMVAAELGKFLLWHPDLSLRKVLDEEMARHGIRSPLDVSITPTETTKLAN
jgi:hypothetical protein